MKIKNLFYLLSFTLVAAFLFVSCEDEPEGNVEPISIESTQVKVVPVEYAAATTTTSGTPDTTIVSLPSILSPVKIQLFVSLDSLSGAHNATHVLQVNPSFTDENTWQTKDTVVGNGVSVDDILSSDVYYGRARIYSISNGTAQSFEKVIAGAYVSITDVQ